MNKSFVHPASELLTLGHSLTRSDPNKNKAPPKVTKHKATIQWSSRKGSDNTLTIMVDASWIPNTISVAAWKQEEDLEESHHAAFFAHSPLEAESLGILKAIRWLQNNGYKDVSLLTDCQFELATTLKEYVGRESPLYYAQRLSNHYKNNNGQGPDIYLKREDLTHSGSHKMNNAIAQVMIAKRLGLDAVVTATGRGQHGLATAAACAKLSLECTILMGSLDMERHPSSVLEMKMLGAKVKSVQGRFKDASSEAIRSWVSELETTYYLAGAAVGPHPCPTMVREFQSVIGKEVRKQAMEKWGRKPNVLVACVGSGSNALGLFHEFLEDQDVRLIGVEGAGSGLFSGKHAATLAKGEVGVYQGMKSYLLQDDEGQILGTQSIAGGLEYAGVSPEMSFLKDMGRVEIHSARDKEAVEAYEKLCRLEGMFPDLKASHALAILENLCPTLPNGTKVVVNCSGSGEDDAATVLKYKHECIQR